jgi:hypothetical protein
MFATLPRFIVRSTSSLQISGNSWKRSPMHLITMKFIQSYQVSYDERSGTRYSNLTDLYNVGTAEILLDKLT